MTKLSVNVNKIATLRNSRGGNVPDLLKVVSDIERFGAQGITVHPRPDERHIKYQDTRDLTKVVTTEFNIEGNPIDQFVELVLETKPTQVTLVPDSVDAITSNAGWDTIAHKDFLKEVIQTFKAQGIRTSIFVDADTRMVEGAANTGTDRIELYTESYAKTYVENKEKAVLDFTKAAEIAHSCGLGVNAGHDLSLDNIAYFKKHVPHLLEVSIGHALICESLYFGLDNVVNMYLNKLK
ncbi:pyridoxine 5'-phosphate synthase [Maribacter sp. 2307UL18-2]|uniref:pyridoxine 5'-phosphate synthase n=1 Tax=Maribacter sp. 2307UL18-2 TaxID=3386274 RepID=UPI0039BC5D38